MLEVNFMPFPLLTTARLLLRQLSAADTARIFEMRTDPVAMKYLGKPPMQKESEALALIEAIKLNLDNNDGITWAIALKEEPADLIGTIGYWKITKEHYRAEIGYMLMPRYFNKGYMTEAIIKTNEYAFNEMKLHSIEANINPFNAASEAILLKTGFVKEAHFRESFYFNGTFEDSAIYSLIKK